MVNALPNFYLNFMILGTLLGTALIAYAKNSQSNARLNFLPIRAHGTTNLDLKSQSHFHPARGGTGFFSLNNNSLKQLIPLNKGQSRFREESDFLDSQRGEILPLPRFF